MQWTLGHVPNYIFMANDSGLQYSSSDSAPSLEDAAASYLAFTSPAPERIVIMQRYEQGTANLVEQTNLYVPSGVVDDGNSSGGG